MPLTEGHLFFCHSLSHFIIAQLLFNQLLRWLNSYLQLVISLSHSYMFATSSPRIMNHSFINNLLFSSITCNNPWLGRSCWQQQVDEQREVRNTEKRDRNEDSTLQENQLILPPKRSGLVVTYEKSAWTCMTLITFDIELHHCIVDTIVWSTLEKLHATNKWMAPNLSNAGDMSIDHTSKPVVGQCMTMCPQDEIQQ